jgi:N-acetylmuramoyl-L-alanine amidase
MRLPILFPIAAATIMAASAVASAAVPHTVARGESLYSVAAADGLSVDQLAAANGLAPNAQLISGRTLMVPPQTRGAGAGWSGVAAGPSGAAGSAEGAAAVSAPSGGGSYVVQPGDTLSGIAARAGMSVSELAAANGLDPSGVLLSGRPLSLSGATPSASPATSPAESQPVGVAAEGSSDGPPYPTSETVSPQEVGQVATSEGVSPSLAEAIADQESGFNNAAVSPSSARGVMQILPGTWDWIGQTLSGRLPLAPASALSNVRAGVLLLHSLLNSTGGNPALTAAGYYQGLPSVERNGLYPSTQQYVNDVMGLRQRFGGG